MALSQSTTRELTRELVSLEKDRKKLDDKIAAIKHLLGEAAAIQPHLVETRAATRAQTQPDASLGTTVLQVIRDRPGIKIPDVTKALVHIGFAIGGATPIGHRVYNEVWRLTKRGEVKKTSDGGYVPVNAHVQ